MEYKEAIKEYEKIYSKHFHCAVYGKEEKKLVKKLIKEIYISNSMYKK